MIYEFVFFICIAATCFSGLLLTLYLLGELVELFENGAH
jgi:hypothetical protein